MIDVYSRVTQLLVDLIQVPSITPVEAKHRGAAVQTLDILEKELAPYGAKFERLSYSGGHQKWDYAVDNLYIEWTFGEPDYHLCFLGHTDVVPVGDLKRWSVAPFSGVKKDGWIYGRGATDMKGAIAAYALAIAELALELQKRPAADMPNLRLSMIITTDEEWAAINGTDKVLDWLRSIGKHPDSFIVGEPSSQDILGSHIKIGRRGSLCGTIVAKGVQGHAAYSGLFVNPNRALCLAASILQTQAFNDQQGDFPRSEFEIIALDSGSFQATAIIPAKASALWNCRFTARFTPSQVLDTLKHILSNPPQWARQHPDFDLLQNVEIVANIDTVSTPYYSAPQVICEIAVEAVQSRLNISPLLDGSGGTTDGRFIHRYFPAAEIIELGLPEKGGMQHGHDTAAYGTQGGMHQVNERCLEKDLHGLYDIYYSILASVQRRFTSQRE